MQLKGLSGSAFKDLLNHLELVDAKFGSRVQDGVQVCEHAQAIGSAKAFGHALAYLRRPQ